MSHVETDVLILGAGSAGLVTALNARGRRISILSPANDQPGDTASDCAQGGIAAAMGADDTPSLHLRDTLRAGGNHNSMAAAALACCEARRAIEYLESLGVPFARLNGERSLHREAAHSRARVLHAGGDATGAAIMRTLRSRIVDAQHVELLPNMRAVSLLTDSSGVCGVLAVDENARAIHVQARDVVIATGGVGGLYSRTTNPSGACGDGPAMALAVGARCDALEFVQFHPTALDVNTRPLPLMTEALRGAGAKIIDETGVSIMAAHPLAELAPRDVVARAIYAVQSAGHRVWLDATRLRDADVAENFPLAFRQCHAHGIDARREPIPITPAAHYHMGGIAVDLESRASLPHLWAVGEAACTGMHGANRLASNSLLEAVVFGRRLGCALARERRPAGSTASRASSVEMSDASVEDELRELMWRCMGVIRNAECLAEGLAVVARLRERTADAMPGRSRLLLAENMLLAAMQRRESRGAHHRYDHVLSAPAHQGVGQAGGFNRIRELICR